VKRKKLKELTHFRSGLIPMDGRHRRRDVGRLFQLLMDLSEKLLRNGIPETRDRFASAGDQLVGRALVRYLWQ
jgi:hypothetical protein